jgi:hypothetical protein
VVPNYLVVLVVPNFLVVVLLNVLVFEMMVHMNY